MKTKDVQIGETYMASATGKRVRCRVESRCPQGVRGMDDDAPRFYCINLETGKDLIRTARQLKAVPGAKRAPKIYRYTLSLAFYSELTSHANVESALLAILDASPAIQHAKIFEINRK